MAQVSGADSEARLWEPISPLEVGFDPDLEARLDKAIAEKRIWNLHGLVVLRNSRLVLERYFEGEDWARGVGATGLIQFKSDTMHDYGRARKALLVYYTVSPYNKERFHRQRQSFSLPFLNILIWRTARIETGLPSSMC